MTEIPVSSPRENDIFICHAIEDAEFVKKLERAIRHQGRDPWTYQEDLKEISLDHPEAWDYIRAGIESADVFVFVISSLSVTIDRTQKELHYAIECQKRLIALVWEPVPPHELPDPLREHAPLFVDLDNEINIFEKPVKTIIQTLIYERLLEKAVLWHDSDRKPELLLDGADLYSLKRWLKDNPDLKPQLIELQEEYLNLSIKADLENPQPKRPDVFISYSRRDKKFVQELCSSLKQNRFNVWIDWENIPVAADWKQEIYEGIQTAHKFIFVISKDSAISPYCADEIDHAVEKNKPIIPILARKDYDKEALHPEIRKRNWLYFDEDFDRPFPKLINAIQTDLSYVKTYDRLLERAIEWETNGQNPDLLLRGSQLKEAVRWVNDSANKQPELLPQHSRYIAASATANARERLRLVAGLSGVALLTILGIGALFSYATATSGKIEALLDPLSNDEKELDALVTGVKAGKELKQFVFAGSQPDLKTKATSALFQEIANLNERNRLLGHQGQVYAALFSHNQHFLASAGQDSTIRLWQTDGTAGPVLTGHDSDVVSLDITPDDRVLASGGYDGRINLWQMDPTTGQVKGKPKVLDAHQNRINMVRFSQGGQLLASASRDGTVKLWTVNGTFRQTLDHDGAEVYCIRFAPDGTLITSSSDGKVRLWSPRNDFRQPIKILNQGSFVFWATFSHDGKTIASASYDGTIKLWDRQGNLLQSVKGHERVVYRVEFSPDDRYLATVSEDGTAKIWSRTGELLHTLQGHQGGVYRLAFSPDSRTLATGGRDGLINLWRIEDGSLLDTLQGHTNNVLGLEFSRDGALLVSASADGSVRLWNPKNSFVQYLPHLNRVNDVTFSADGRIVASGGIDTIRLWNATGSPKTAYDAHAGDVRSVSFSPEGRFLISSGDDGAIKLWQPDGQPIRTLVKYQEPIEKVRFSRDGQLIASGGDDHAVTLWQTNDGNASRLRTLAGDGKPVIDLSFDHQGQFLAVVSNASKSLSYTPPGPSATAKKQLEKNGDVKLWKVDGTFLLSLKAQHELSIQGQLAQPFSADFSPTENLLAVSLSNLQGNVVQLWKAMPTANGQLTLKPVGMLQGHTAPILKVVFSPDGQLIATSSRDNTIKLWTKDGIEVATLRKHKREVSSLSFSPDGKRLASAGLDGAVYLWELPAVEGDKSLTVLLKEGCQLLQDYLKANPASDREVQGYCSTLNHAKSNPAQ